MFWKKKKYRYGNTIFCGSLSTIKDKYNQFLGTEGTEIVCTSLSQDFSEYGHTKTFVFIVTYKEIV